MAKIRVNIIELSEDLDAKIGEKDFSAAGEIQKLLNALQEQREEIEKEMEPKSFERQDDPTSEFKVQKFTIHSNLVELYILVTNCVRASCGVADQGQPRRI